MRAGAALALRGIVKRFGVTTALDGASLEVRAGSLHALLGENGAGKTTLMRVAFGMLAPDAGQVLVDDRAVHLQSPADAIALGLGAVHQHYMNVPALTVAENVALGGHGRFDRRAILETIRRIGDETGFVLDPDLEVESLSVAAQQRLEIVKALAHRATILILDEPTAVLAPAEAEALLKWLRQFVGAGGTAVLITHKLPEALSWADEITVLRLGRTVAQGVASTFDPASLVRAIVGEDLPFASTVAAAPPGPPVAKLAGVAVRAANGALTLRDADLEIRAREILGVAGVDRSGHAELLRVLAGRVSPSIGTVDIPPTVGFIPEDRQRDAIVAEFSLTENLALRGAGVRRGTMSWSGLMQRTVTLAGEFDVRGGNPSTPVRALSGGNQQRFVVGRELAGDPALIVAENPTRGLDVRSTAYVHERLRAAARAGAAVILYSSDLDEVMSLATRMCVVHNGRVAEVPSDRAAIGRAMLGMGVAA